MRPKTTTSPYLQDWMGAGPKVGGSRTCVLVVHPFAVLEVRGTVQTPCVILESTSPGKTRLPMDSPQCKGRLKGGETHFARNGQGGDPGIGIPKISSRPFGLLGKSSCLVSGARGPPPSRPTPPWPTPTRAGGCPRLATLVFSH